MANANSGTPDPKNLQKIREYLIDSGIQGAELDKRMKDIAASTKQFNLELSNANKHFAEMSSSFDDLRTQIKNAADDLKGVDSTSSKINKSFKNLVDISNRLAHDAQGINELNAKDLKNLEKKLLIEVSNLDFLHKQLQLKYKNANLDNLRRIAQEQGIKHIVQEIDQLKELNAAAADQKNYMTAMLALIQARLAQEKMINKALGISGKLVDGMVGALGKLGISSEFFENLKEDMREAAKSGSKLQVLKVALHGVFKGLGQALKEPLFYVTAIYKAMQGIVKLAIAYEAKTFEAGRALGINVTESTKLLSNFQEIAWANGQMGITAKQLVDTYAQMNQTLGFMGPRNSEMLATTLGIQRAYGVSAENLQDIQMFSAKTGKSLKDTFQSVIGSAKAMGARLKISMSEKQIMEGISKVSATVFNNFKGNVRALSEAVVKATKFGVTLDQINQAGMSMLDFESSISKEFEAQLLTGRNINLSMARQYALTGQTDKLMGEITRQLGSQNQWNSMNVLQQQSLAEAMGMTKEAVDEIYKKQALADILGAQAGADAATEYQILKEKGKTHAEIVELMGQQSAEDALRASVQDKMAATMERIRDTIGQMAQVIMPVVEAFANMLSNTTSLKILLGGAVIAAGLIATSAIMAANAKRQEVAAQLQLNLITAEGAAMLLPLQARQAALAEIEVIRAGASATAGSGYLGPAALGVGVAVIAGLMAYLSSATGGAAGSSSPTMAPSAGISPANTTAASVGQQSENTRVTASANERPMNVYIRSEVVDTASNMSGRVDRGIYYDKSKIS